MAMRSNVGRSRRGMVSDINVTPFVDVMLVLLIIFMVAAPMMIQGIDVKLPAASARPIPTETEKLVVSIAADGQIYVNESVVDIEILGSRLTAAHDPCVDKRGVILRADRKIEYGLVVRVMGIVREAGIEQISMVTEPAAISRGLSGQSGPRTRSIGTEER